MKLLLDQNLSRKIPSLLQELVPRSEHVAHCGLDRSSDEEVWHYARESGYVILSKDSDFHQMSLLRGFPPKVIFLKIGNCATQTIVSMLLGHAQDLNEFDQDTAASLLILEG